MKALYGRCEMELYFPSSFSLKDKRRTLKSLLDRIRDKLNVSVSEVDYQDQHRLSQVSFAVTSSSRSKIDQIFDNLEDLIEGDPTLQIRNIERSIT